MTGAHEQIDITVTVYVREHRSAVPIIFRYRIGKGQPGRCGDVAKTIVAIIAVEKIWPDVTTHDE